MHSNADFVKTSLRVSQSRLSYPLKFIELTKDYATPEKKSRFKKKKDKQEDMFERISGDDASRQVYLFGYTRLLFSLLVAVDYYATSDYMNGIKLKAFGQLNDISNIIQAYEKTGTQQSIREYEKTKYPQRRERLVKKKKADVINDLRTEMFLDAENTLKEHINDHIFYL